MRASTTVPFAAQIAALATLALLSACGGGGGDGTPPPTATVTSASVAATNFGTSAFVQMSGTNLDTGMAISSNECRGLTRLSTPPYVSSATIAYYSCTVVRLGGTITMKNKADGATLKSVTFTVPSPQVKMTWGGAVAASIYVDLDADKVPDTVANFLAYVNSTDHRYENTIIHRVVRPQPLTGNLSIIQGGGYGPTNSVVLGNHIAQFSPIALQTDPTLLNVAGTIAMARAADPNSATSEYYFNVDANPGLDGSYAVFGHLHTPGDIVVLQAIQASACTPYPGDQSGSCIPLPNVVLQDVAQTL